MLLLVVALHGLDVLCDDIQNDYLSVPNKEKVWIRAGQEFLMIPGMEDVLGNVLVVTCALYCLKSVSTSFRAYLAEKLDSIESKYSHTDPDVLL